MLAFLLLLDSHNDSLRPEILLVGSLPCRESKMVKVPSNESDTMLPSSEGDHTPPTCCDSTPSPTDQVCVGACLSTSHTCHVQYQQMYHGMQAIQRL